MTLFTIWLVALAVFVALLALPLAVAPLRRALVSRPLLAKFRKVMPPMSQTEREALEAGTVGWDGELFRGRPAWEELLAIPKTALTAEEQRFLDHEVETLCAMVSDWETTNVYKDLPPHVMLELERFFRDYKILEGKESVVDKMYDRTRALAVIRAALEGYRHKEAWKK